MTQKNYWPHFIIALITFAIALGVWTVKMAIDNPVELDNSYMMKYQDVDENYYKIEQMAKAFDKSYRIKLLNEKLKKGKNRLIFEVLDKKGKPVKDAQVELLITRPETSKYDKKIRALYKNGKYEAEVNLPLEGRWNIITKVTVGNVYRYVTYKRSTRRIIHDNLKKS